MGVDLGLSYVKVSIARPGKGLELVTNEQAKRKTPAVVGFTEEGERLFGDAAVAYAGKAPSRVVLDGRNLIGQCAADPTDDSLRCPRKVIQVDGAGEFSGEHVMAMLLGMARRQASAALDGASVKDVVVSVPAWYDHHDRVSITDAARVIGLNCLAVVNANTAAAVKYALDGKGIAAGASGKSKKRTQTVMFYDLGAGSATASIAEIATDSKGVATSVKMLGHAWEHGVGGRAFDEIIINKMASDFDAQRGSDATPAKDIPRVMMRLRKEAQRVREILSANTDTVVSVPSLWQDLDFRTTAKRDDFEAGAQDLFHRAVKPAKKVLSETGLKVEDLDAVVPFGGASRTPKVQELLCSELGISSLNKSINSDEAAVMGNAFFAASLSSTFRVRKMEIEDVYGRGISAEVERNEKSGGMFSSGKGKGDPQKVVVFKPTGAKLPSKKTLSFKRTDDFTVEIFVDKAEKASGRYPDRTLYARARIAGASKVLKKFKEAKNAKGVVPNIALTIVMDRSGFVRIGNAESSADEVVEVEREVPIKEDLKADKKDGKKSDKKSDKKKEEADEKDSSSGSGATKENGPEEGVKEEKKDSDKKPKTRLEKSKQTLVHRQTLTVKYNDVPTSLHDVWMNKKELEQSKKVLKGLELADLDRQERADALNSLEGFILEVRSSVRSADEGEPLYEVTTEEERSKFVTQLDDAEDWMYTDDAKDTVNLKGKLSNLKTVHDDMKLRADEVIARPAAVQSLRQLIGTTEKTMSTLKALHEKGGSKDMGVFDELFALIGESSKWVDRMELEQKSLASTATPAFTSKDVQAKAKALSAKAVLATRLKLPEAPKEATDPNAGEDADRASGGHDGGNGKGAKNQTVGEDTGKPEEPPKVDVEPPKADVSTDSEVRDEL